MEKRLKVIIEDLTNHPYCEHGPTLLFNKLSQGKEERYFACSACRDRNLCSFYMKYEKLKDVHLSFKKLESDKKNSSRTLKEVTAIPPKDRCYCKNCNNFFEKKYLREHITHETIISVDEHMLKTPSKLLVQKNNDKKEAQYFFDSQSITCIVDNFVKLKLNRIICIGAPTLHEYLMNNFEKLQIKSILMDIDNRLASFYDEKEFFWYNMFNHYFFGGEKSVINFENFLLEKENENLCIFTDPPFACRTEPLAYTLNEIGNLYKRINKCIKVLPIIWIFPYFMETYISNAMPELSMLDYQVNYINHKTYHNGLNGRKQGSPVRIFTNILPSLFVLPVKEGYKFCTICSLFVAGNNKHCNICNICPSKNGSTYKHCQKCSICVKANYKHCDNCGRCSQIAGHNCAQYTKNIICWICRKSGHSEKNCHNLQRILKIKRNIKNNCFICTDRNDHNIRNCSKRKDILGEKYFLGKYTNIFD